MSAVEAVLDRVAQRRPRVIELSLDRVHAALRRLGDPHKALPPVFHVAGTNGKGSTVAYIKAILEAAGEKVHAYTSPHLVCFNERIVLAGAEISDKTLIDAIERCDRAIGEDKLTYFETTTCAAFLAFAETQADYLVLEVGLGGRLDATNVIDKPLAAIVSPVALDHQQFLGDRLALVAAEKAGIFRKDAPAVIGPQDPEAMGVIEAHAQAAAARTFTYGQQWHCYAEHGRLIYQDDDGLSDLDPPGLVGAHQIDNAGLAVAAVKAAGLGLPDAVISKGLARASWPARMQRLTHGPLIDIARKLLGEAPEIWLDGGHNPHAGRAIARVMADMEERTSKPLVMIAGMQANKDAVGYFTPFAGLVSEFFAVAANHSGVAPAQEVEAKAREAGLNARVCKSVEEAMRRAVREKEANPPRILIGGSLYLAGEILKENG